MGSPPHVRGSTRGAIIFLVGGTLCGWWLGNQETTAREKRLESSLQVCDTEVLRAEIKLRAAVEEFWSARWCPVLRKLE